MLDGRGSYGPCTQTIVDVCALHRSSGASIRSTPASRIQEERRARPRIMNLRWSTEAEMLLAYPDTCTLRIDREQLSLVQKCLCRQFE
mmetsp:Transcript_39725/g.115950  ORF Transcript_39725/g.115950 Transcript_39725/m.115950 type:complete len:88 (+) Transcript_39725:1281-1544(+)